MVNRVIGTSGPQLYTQQEAQDLLSAATVALGTMIFISDIGDAPGTLSTFDGQDWKAVVPPSAPSTDFVTANTVYVAKNGDDVNGTGSAEKPFSTITAALQSLATAPTQDYIVVSVASGVYTENIEITRPRTLLKGENGAALGTQIRGSVSLNPQYLEGNNYTSVFAIDDILITQSLSDPNDAISFSGSVPAYIRIRNVKVVSTTGNKGIYFSSTSTPRSNVYFENVDVKSAGNAFAGSNFNGFSRGFCALESTGAEAVNLDNTKFTFNAGSVIVSQTGDCAIALARSDVFIAFSSVTNNAPVLSGTNIINVENNSKLRLGDVHFFSTPLGIEPEYIGFALNGDETSTIEIGNLTFFGNYRAPTTAVIIQAPSTIQLV